MMNPKALEALRKARELFAEKADDIPSDAQPIEPIRKPRVVLIPTNAPKFSKESMKQENKAQAVARVMQENGMTPPPMVEGQSVIYATMSVTEACEVCLKKSIKKPSDIAKETGKNVKQIYTALWHIKQRKKKARAEAKEAKRFQFNGDAPKFVPPKSLDKVNWETPSWETPSDDFDREPTPFEDAHMVVLHDRQWYEKEIEKLYTANSELLIQIQELKTVIKYLEGKYK